MLNGLYYQAVGGKMLAKVLGYKPMEEHAKSMITQKMCMTKHREMYVKGYPEATPELPKA